MNRTGTLEEQCTSPVVWWQAAAEPTKNGKDALDVLAEIRGAASATALEALELQEAYQQRVIR